MIIRALRITMLLLTIAVPGVVAQNTASSNPVVLTIAGEVAKPLKLTAADLDKLPRRSIRARDHAGREAGYEGIELNELLKLAGVKFGDDLRGKALALFLVAEASDHYRAVFALPELDHDYTDKVVLLADRRDGKPLADNEGPRRLVVSDEKRQARWVRQIITLTVRRAE